MPPANLTGTAAPGLLAPGAIDLFLKAGALLGLQSGYVAMFARNGQVVYGATAGYADIASGTPMTLDTKFRIASMTKPVTATAAMILVEEGRLRLDDPVSNYIPAAANLRVATSQSAAAAPANDLLIVIFRKPPDDSVHEEPGVSTIGEDATRLSLSTRLWRTDHGQRRPA